MSSLVTFDNCTLRNNFAKYGGVGYANSEGHIRIHNSLLESNYAYMGNVFYSINSMETSYVEESTFINNEFGAAKTDIAHLDAQNFTTPFVVAVKADPSISKLQLTDEIMLLVSRSIIVVKGTLQLINQPKFLHSSAISEVYFTDFYLSNVKLDYLIEATDSVVQFSNAHLA